MGTPSVMPRRYIRALHALAAENAQQIVFEREEKARGAGIALAASAPAQLIVDAPRFVAFGAENVQAAEGDHFIVFGFALIGKLVVDRLPLIERHLEDFALRAGTAPCGTVAAAPSPFELSAPITAGAAA